MGVVLVLLGLVLVVLLVGSGASCLVGLNATAAAIALAS